MNLGASKESGRRADHKISTSAALDLYIKKLKVEAGQVKPSGLSLKLQQSLSQEKWELLMSYVRHNYTNEELSQVYLKNILIR